MLFVGQQATWPNILFIQNRMTTERLIEYGLHLDDRHRPFQKLVDPGKPRNNGHFIASSALAGEFETHGSKLVKRRRSSMFEEVKRQAGIFLDDTGAEGETTGESEIEESL